MENCDAIVFPSSISSSLSHFSWEKFLDFIFEKNHNDDFPIWLMWQSLSLFSWPLELEKKWKNKNFKEELVLDFLDTKPFDAIFFNSFIFKQEVKWLNALFKNVEELANDKYWKPCVLRKWKIFATTFSPEFSDDVRIYEYFINEFID